MTSYSDFKEILPFITILMTTWMYCINTVEYLLKLALHIAWYNATPECSETGNEGLPRSGGGSTDGLTSAMQTCLWGLGRFSRSTRRSVAIGHWRLTCGPGSEATAPETPPGIWGLRALRPLPLQPLPPACEPDQLSGVSESPCANVTDSLPTPSHPFSSLCAVYGNVKLWNYFEWASGGCEPLGISSAKLLTRRKTH